MLHQELPRIESTPLDGWGRWLAPALIGGAAVSVAFLCLLLAQPRIAVVAIVAGVIGAGWVLAKAPRESALVEPLAVGPDFSLVGSALGLSREPTALTTGDGSALIVNTAYRERFGSNVSPLSLATDDEARQGLDLAKTMAWRDGAGCVRLFAAGADVSYRAWPPAPLPI